MSKVLVAQQNFTKCKFSLANGQINLKVKYFDKMMLKVNNKIRLDKVREHG